MGTALYLMNKIIFSIPFEEGFRTGDLLLGWRGMNTVVRLDSSTQRKSLCLNSPSWKVWGFLCHCLNVCFKHSALRDRFGGLTVLFPVTLFYQLACPLCIDAVGGRSNTSTGFTLSDTKPILKIGNDMQFKRLSWKSLNSFTDLH